MSDNWITITPKDPNHIPERTRREKAQKRLMEIAIRFDEVKIILSDNIVLFDCGCNFEKVYCPNCNSRLSGDWWHKRMSQDFQNGSFQLDKFLTPCCGYSCALNELVYDWHHGFGKFAIEVLNPEIDFLKEKHLSEFENILGTKVDVIYGHF